MISYKRVDPPEKVIDILEKEKLKNNGSYNKEEVVNELVKQFYGKCYICELKDPSSVNIEHLRPHKGDKELKFDWNNLFLSCVHCNNTKLAKYDNILDCTDPDKDIENCIKFYADSFPTNRVKITALNDDPQVINTVELLNTVYNGLTPQKKIECISLVKKLNDELYKFQKDLWKYNEATDDEVKNEYRLKIKQHLHNGTSFTAFKRCIIKEIIQNNDKFKEFNNIWNN